MPEAAGGIPGSADPREGDALDHAPDGPHDLSTLTLAPGAADPRAAGCREPFTTGARPESGFLEATGVCLSHSGLGSPGRRGQGRGRRAVPRARPSGRGRGTPPPGVQPGCQRRPQGSPTDPAPRAPPPVPAPRPPERARPAGLTLIGGGAVPGEALAPGTPLRPSLPQSPAPLPCSPAGAGEEAPRRFPGGRSLRASSGPDEGSPRPRARPAPAAPGPPPPVTKAGPRPDTGGAREERARLRVAGVNVPDVGRVGVASAPSAARPVRPAPGRGVEREPWRPRCKRRLPRGGRSAPPGRRLDGRCRSPAPTGPAQVGVASPESWLGARVLTASGTSRLPPNHFMRIGKDSEAITERLLCVRL